MIMSKFTGLLKSLHLLLAQIAEMWVTFQRWYKTTHLEAQAAFVKRVFNLHKM